MRLSLAVTGDAVLWVAAYYSSFYQRIAVRNCYWLFNYSSITTIDSVLQANVEEYFQET